MEKPFARIACSLALSLLSFIPLFYLCQGWHPGVSMSGWDKLFLFGQVFLFFTTCLDFALVVIKMEEEETICWWIKAANYGPCRQSPKRRGSRRCL